MTIGLEEKHKQTREQRYRQTLDNTDRLLKPVSLSPFYLPVASLISPNLIPFNNRQGLDTLENVPDVGVGQFGREKDGEKL